MRRTIERVVNGRASLEFHSAHDPQRMHSVDGIEHTVVRFTTDIPYLTKWGQPLLIGPGSILVAHTDHEQVKKSELLRSVEIYVDLVKKLALQNRER